MVHVMSWVMQRQPHVIVGRFVRERIGNASKSLPQADRGARVGESGNLLGGSSQLVNTKLGGGIKYFFIFTPKIGEDSHFDEDIFQMG